MKGLVPLLLDLKVPGPLQVEVVVVVEEARFHLVLSTGHHARRGLLHLEFLLVGLRRGSIAANHLLTLVNYKKQRRKEKVRRERNGQKGKKNGMKRKEKKKDYTLDTEPLHDVNVLEASDDLVLDTEVNLQPVVATLLDGECPGL